MTIQCKISLLLTPILEYIQLIIKQPETQRDSLIFQLVVRLPSIITIKCQKYNIILDKSDLLMEYLEQICIMIKKNQTTTTFIQLINSTDKRLQSKMSSILYESPYTKAKTLRKMTSSIDDETQELDILTLSDIELHRWNSITKLLNRV